MARPAAFFVKGQRVNTLGLVSHLWSLPHRSLCFIVATLKKYSARSQQVHTSLGTQTVICQALCIQFRKSNHSRVLGVMRFLEHIPWPPACSPWSGKSLLFPHSLQQRASAGFGDQTAQAAVDLHGAEGLGSRQLSALPEHSRETSDIARPPAGPLHP